MRYTPKAAKGMTLHIVHQRSEWQSKETTKATKQPTIKIAASWPVIPTPSLDELQNFQEAGANHGGNGQEEGENSAAALRLRPRSMAPKMVAPGGRFPESWTSTGTGQCTPPRTRIFRWSAGWTADSAGYAPGRGTPRRMDQSNGHSDVVIQMGVQPVVQQNAQHTGWDHGYYYVAPQIPGLSFFQRSFLRRKGI